MVTLLERDTQFVRLVYENAQRESTCRVSRAALRVLPLNGTKRTALNTELATWLPVAPNPQRLAASARRASPRARSSQVPVKLMLPGVNGAQSPLRAVLAFTKRPHNASAARAAAPPHTTRRLQSYRGRTNRSHQMTTIASTRSLCPSTTCWPVCRQRSESRHSVVRAIVRSPMIASTASHHDSRQAHGGSPGTAGCPCTAMAAVANTVVSAADRAVSVR